MRTATEPRVAALAVAIGQRVPGLLGRLDPAQADDLLHVASITGDPEAVYLAAGETTIPDGFTHAAPRQARIGHDLCALVQAARLRLGHIDREIAALEAKRAALRDLLT